MATDREPSSGPLRRTAYFSGRVQGVGFRYTTERLAADFDLVGHVRNLPDGRVELIAEGEANELDRFLRAIERALGGNIRETQSSDSPATGEFSSFRIAF